jgi:hypothetical protein
MKHFNLRSSSTHQREPSTKDKRYDAIKGLLDSNKIRVFQEIFDYIPKSIVSKDLGLNYQTFIRKVHYPGLFTVRETQIMCKLMHLSLIQLVDLISNSFIK